jgi:xylulokinase
LAATLNRRLVYRKSSEVGAAYGASRLGRLALTGEKPDAVSVPPPVKHVIEPDPELSGRLRERRRIFTQLYRNLKNTFLEFSQ